MERVALTAQIREKAGKGVARSLRRDGKVPAVLYGHGKSQTIAMGGRDMTKVLNMEGGEHALITLTVEGAKGPKEIMALIKDFQVDPISGKLIHIDLLEVAMDKKVRVPVSIHITGSAFGVKEGGILQFGLRELEVECLPNQIPDRIEVDITHLAVNESLHVRDIAVPQGVKFLADPEGTIATIQPPISAEKLESILAAAPVAAEGEPELVKKPKGEAAAAPAAEAKGKEAAPAKEAAAPKK